MTRTILAVSLLAAGCALAQGELEVLELRHRSAAEVIPILQPLLEPGAVLTGQGDRLIVRASPRNLAEIRSVLASLDRAPRRLVISVRHGASAEEMRRGAEGRVELRSGDSHAAVRIHDSADAARERLEQRVQVLEGARAFIATGAARPLAVARTVRTPEGRILRESTTVMQQALTGFEVVPRLSGDTVHLEISPQREALGPAGSVRGERVWSALRARLGEWVEIGALDSAASTTERGVFSTRDARRAGSTSIWVKVEEVPN